MQARDVAANHGGAWLKDGFRLFLKAPLTWWLILGGWLIAYLVLAMLFDAVGAAAYLIVYPGLWAGVMLGCRALDQGRPLQLGHLVAGFKRNARQLLALGVITLVAGLALGTLANALFPIDPEAVELLQKRNADPAILLPLLGPHFTAMFAASLPIMVLTWFGPPLLAFHDMSAVDAIRWSFYACVANMGAFTIYALIGFGLFVVALLPFGLGLLLLLPTLAASAYTSYKDIFIDGGEG